MYVNMNMRWKCTILSTDNHRKLKEGIIPGDKGYKSYFTGWYCSTFRNCLFKRYDKNSQNLFSNWKIHLKLIIGNFDIISLASQCWGPILFNFAIFLDISSFEPILILKLLIFVMWKVFSSSYFCSLHFFFFLFIPYSQNKYHNRFVLHYFTSVLINFLI